MFTGKEEHNISLEEAKKLVQNFQKKLKGDEVKAQYLGGEAIRKLLDQPGCVGVRIYYAENDEGKPELVIVGVTAEGKDLTDGIILERNMPCPPFCFDESELNLK